MLGFSLGSSGRPGRGSLPQVPAALAGCKYQLEHVSAARHDEDMLPISASPTAPGGFYQIAAFFPGESERGRFALAGRNER